jgi:hypothetical protein
MTTTFNFRIDAKLRSAAKKAAALDQRSLVGLIIHLLYEHCRSRHPQMKGSKVMAEDYAQVVDVLHDAALAIDASDDLIMTHPREVHCPDRFRRKNISRAIRGAAERMCVRVGRLDLPIDP